jgi:hypothetical protein
MEIHLEVIVTLKDGREFKYAGVTMIKCEHGLYSIMYEDENGMARYDKFPTANIGMIHEHTASVESYDEILVLKKKYGKCNERIYNKKT